jgi:hypothetical protein
MRNESGAKGEGVSDVADAVLAVAEKPDDPSAGWLGDCLETAHDIGCEGRYGRVGQLRVHVAILTDVITT